MNQESMLDWSVIFCLSRGGLVDFPRPAVEVKEVVSVVLSYLSVKLKLASLSYAEFSESLRLVHIGQQYLLRILPVLILDYNENLPPESS